MNEIEEAVELLVIDSTRIREEMLRDSADMRTEMTSGNDGGAEYVAQKIRTIMANQRQLDKINYAMNVLVAVKNKQEEQMTLPLNEPLNDPTATSIYHSCKLGNNPGGTCIHLKEPFDYKPCLDCAHFRDNEAHPHH